MKQLALQIFLFLLTVALTTFAGMEWITARSVLIEGLNWTYLSQGFWYYTVPFLGFLTVHEFGHFIMAKIRKIDVTLPYYIPLWFGVGSSFGTMGAFIRIKEIIKTRNGYFDVGVAGPLAGFVVAVSFLIYGYAHLPGHDFVFNIHPDYEVYGAEYGKYVYGNTSLDGVFRLGDSLLSGWIRETFADPVLLPHENELTHYPYILAGFLGLFFTALNLMPIGQLDGGHILFSLIGEKRFNIVSPILFGVFVFYAGLGFFSIDELQQSMFDEGISGLWPYLIYIFATYLSFSRITTNNLTNWIITLSVVLLQLLLAWLMPNLQGYSGFLAFGVLLGRFLGVYHPPVHDKKPLNAIRVVIGCISLIIFVLCISPNPFY